MAIVRADSVRTLAYTGISASYAAVGAATAHAWRMFKITNNTNGDLYISFDGTTNNLFVPAYTFTLYDLSTNGPPIGVSDNFQLQVGTQFYAKQVSAPSVGTLYVEGIYAKGE